MSEGLEKVKNNSLVSSKLHLGSFQDVVINAFNNKLLPTWVKTWQQGVMVAQYCKELGLPVGLRSFEYVYVLNNQVRPNGKGLSALLGKHKYKVEVLREYTKIKITDDERHLYLNGNVLYFKKNSNGGIEISTKEEGGIPLNARTMFDNNIENIVTTMKITSPKGESYIVNYSLNDQPGILTKDAFKAHPISFFNTKCISKAVQLHAQDLLHTYIAEELSENYRNEEFADDIIEPGIEDVEDVEILDY